MGVVIYSMANYKVGKEKGGGGGFRLGRIQIYIIIVYFLDPRICWVREKIYYLVRKSDDYQKSEYANFEEPIQKWSYMYM